MGCQQLRISVPSARAGMVKLECQRRRRDFTNVPLSQSRELCGVGNAAGVSTMVSHAGRPTSTELNPEVDPLPRSDLASPPSPRGRRAQRVAATSLNAAGSRLSLPPLSSDPRSHLEPRSAQETTDLGSARGQILAKMRGGRRQGTIAGRGIALSTGLLTELASTW